MGGQSSRPVEFTLTHPKFTNSNLLVLANERTMQTNIGSDSKTYNLWKNSLESANLSSQFLLLPLYHSFSSKGLCGSTGIATIDFSHYPYLLTEEIVNQKGKKRIFEENKLWFLFFALISAKKSMNPPFSKVGDIRPLNIFINDQGNIKVSNLYSWPQEMTNYIKAFDKQITYLAPEEVKQLEMGHLENEKQSSSELFSIGLTLLSAATLEDFSDVYDVNKFTFNSDRVTQKLNQFMMSRAYSDIFKGLVCNLCSFQESTRVTPQQLWTWIEPHQQSIKSRENFFIPSAPQKINQSVVSVRNYISTNGGINPLEVTKQGHFPQKLLQFKSKIRNIKKPVEQANGLQTPLGSVSESTQVPVVGLGGGEGIGKGQENLEQNTN